MKVQPLWVESALSLVFCWRPRNEVTLAFWTVRRMGSSHSPGSHSALGTLAVRLIPSRQPWRKADRYRHLKGRRAGRVRLLLPPISPAHTHSSHSASDCTSLLKINAEPRTAQHLSKGSSVRGRDQNWQTRNKYLRKEAMQKKTWKKIIMNRLKSSEI